MSALLLFHTALWSELINPLWLHNLIRFLSLFLLISGLLGRILFWRLVLIWYINLTEDTVTFKNDILFALLIKVLWVLQMIQRLTALKILCVYVKIILCLWGEPSLWCTSSCKETRKWPKHENMKTLPHNTHPGLSCLAYRVPLHTENKVKQCWLNQNLEEPKFYWNPKKQKRGSRKAIVRDPQSLYGRNLSCLNSLQLSWRLKPVFTQKPEPSAPLCSGGICGLKVMWSSWGSCLPGVSAALLNYWVKIGIVWVFFSFVPIVLVSCGHIPGAVSAFQIGRL